MKTIRPGSVASFVRSTSSVSISSRCSSLERSSPVGLAGIAVPRRVRDALKTSPDDEDTLQAELLALASRIVLQADARSIAVVDDIVDFVSDVLAAEPLAQGAFALRILVTCVPYFGRVGRPEIPVRLARRLVASARSWPGVWARRCAHQFAAVVHLHADDARQAWAHAECAYDLGACCEASSGRFETLVLVVAILDNMGLLPDAKALALQLVGYPDGDPSLDRLHLVNAVNGLALCQRLDDLDTAIRFHEIVAKRDAHADSDLDPVGASVEAANALHLVRLGRARAAARTLDEAVARLKNPMGSCLSQGPIATTEALLRSAQVEVYAALDDRPRLEASLHILKDLLPAFHGASAFHRELLRTIIRFELRRPDQDTAIAMRYLELLRERPNPIAGEAAGTVDTLLQSLLSSIVGGVMGTSTMADVRPFHEVAGRDWARDPWRGRRFADFGFRLPDAEAHMDTDEGAIVLTLPEREAALRTPAFEIAENWAVVAEIAIGGDGRQCFKVGRIAAGLAAALGLSDERTVLVELACRLRDIGDVTLGSAASAAKRSGAGRPRILAEHTQAGARILSFSSDPVLRSAARIAANHHAWWNGCGAPDGLAGESIPIEARICAVADHLVSLVDPIGAREPWPIESAIRQLRCMAGVQLDPELVDVLVSVLHDESMRVEDPALRLNAVPWKDPFEKARKHLIETLELAA